MRQEGFNTTDKLKNIADYLNNNNLLLASQTFNEIMNFHIEALKEQ
jgi:hypothetical protein